MLTEWLLVYFLHNLKGEGIEDQRTLARYPTWMQCEQLKQKATRDKGNLECIGIEVQDFPVKEDARSRFYRSHDKNMHDFKMNQWF